jgi:pimeloyl-ACP methyl ester carboxylesterase
MTKSVVFIHGAWMLPGCWDDFRKPFEAAGYTVHAPAWPYLDGRTAAELRADPPKGLHGLGVGPIVAHYKAFIDALDEPPLIVGHSFGGLYVQLLLDKGAGSAGIAIDPGPIGFVPPGLQSLLAATPPLLKGPTGVYTLPREGFAKNFANTVPAAEHAAIYDRLVVPTPSMIFYQAASWIGTVTHPKSRKQPLLVTGAEFDRTVTPWTSKGIYNYQKAAPSRTDLKMYAGKSHSLIFEQGWETVAGDCLAWAQSL